MSEHQHTCPACRRVYDHEAEFGYECQYSGYNKEYGTPGYRQCGCTTIKETKKVNAPDI